MTVYDPLRGVPVVELTVRKSYPTGKHVVQRLKIKRISTFKDFSSAVISIYSSEISLNRIARMLRIDYKTVDE